MKLIKAVLFTTAFVLSSAAIAQDYVNVRRKAPLSASGRTPLRDEMRVVSQQIVRGFVSGNHQMSGLAQVQIEVPVCGVGSNAVLDVRSTNFSNQLAAMGGPIHLFESQNLDLGFYIRARRGVAIADACYVTRTLVTLTCGYRQPINLSGIPSKYISESVEGITCRYQFEGGNESQPPFIDVTLTKSGIEVFNGL